MKRLAFLLLAFAWAGAALGQDAADRNRGRCVAGVPSPSNLPPLRPMASAICNYGTAELHARIDRLLAVREGRLGIEEVERIFSVPIVTTTYDRPRSAYYPVHLRSAPGRGAWAAGVSVQESYGPDLESRPIRFRGSGRPVRINPRERGEILVNITLAGQEGVEFAPGQAICLPVTDLRDRLVRRGWVVVSTNELAPHAPPGWRPMTLSRGGLRFSTSSYDGQPCVQNFTLWQPADPPLQPLTPPPGEVSMGYGTCEDWTRARYYEPGRAKERVSEGGRRMEQWAWGYLTASQRYRPLPIPNVVAMRDAIWGELDTYCTAHQGTGFGEALSTLVEDFHRRFRSRRR